MANKKLITLGFPGLTDTYTIPQVPDGVAGHLASLDGAGNLLDSNRAPGDFGSAAAVRALLKLAKGQLYDTQTDTDAAYTKTVPSGAVAAEVGSIGGKTVVWNQHAHEIRENNGWNANRSTVSYADGTITIADNRTGDANNTFGVFVGSPNFNNPYNLHIPAGHKLYVRFRYNYTDASADDDFRDIMSNSFADYDGRITTGTTYSINNKSGITEHIFSLSSEYATGGVNIFARTESSRTKTDATLAVSDALFVDLTQMFGEGSEPTETSDPRISAIIAYAEAHPERDTGSLLSAAVTSVVSKDGEDETLDALEIPAAIRALEGYGQSEIGGSSNTLNLADGTYTEIGHYANGVWTALDEPVVTDVSSLLAGTMVETEAGGTLTFVQEGGTELEVPNRTDYLIKLSEVETE